MEEMVPDRNSRKMVVDDGGQKAKVFWKEEAKRNDVSTAPLLGSSPRRAEQKPHCGSGTTRDPSHRSSPPSTIPVLDALVFNNTTSILPSSQARAPWLVAGHQLIIASACEISTRNTQKQTQPVVARDKDGREERRGRGQQQEGGGPGPQGRGRRKEVGGCRCGEGSRRSSSMGEGSQKQCKEVSSCRRSPPLIHPSLMESLVLRVADGNPARPTHPSGHLLRATCFCVGMMSGISSAAWCACHACLRTALRADELICRPFTMDCFHMGY